MDKIQPLRPSLEKEIKRVRKGIEERILRGCIGGGVPMPDRDIVPAKIAAGTILMPF